MPCRDAQNTSVNSPGWTPSPATSSRVSSRDRWVRWHYVRVAVILAAFALLAAALV
jgi:hypothetical protein